MADKPSANGVNGSAEEDAEDALARKKAAKKAKKDQQRLEREAAERQAKQDPNKSTTATETKKKDEDPLGLTLAATTDPLAAAMKFVGPMLQASPKSIDAQSAGFEVYMRRRKYVLALRCLNASLSIDAENPRVHEQVVSFRNMLNNSESDISPKALEALKGEFTALDAGSNLTKYIEEYQSKHKSSPRHVLSAIRAKKSIGADKAKCEKEAIALLDLENIHFSHATEILDTLRSWRSSETEAFKKAAQSKWPEVTRLA